jgi:hypothetical protein
MSYVAGMSLRGVKATGIVRASCIVILVSACWLINRALVRTPHGIRAGGMIITGDVVPRFLFDLCFSVLVWLGSGWINTG